MYTIKTFKSTLSVDESHVSCPVGDDIADSYLRISLATSMENIRKAVERMAAPLAEVPVTA